MTTAADGIRRTDPIMTRTANYASPTEATQDWSGWENWLSARLDQRCEAFGEEVGEAIGDMVGPLEKRLKALELQIAETRGAVDVLRGRGAPGTFRPKGIYDSKTAYSYLDVVVKDSSSFVALRDKPGACPGDDWQMIACGGKRGVAGERGPPGPAGPTPRFAGARFNRNGMELESSAGPIPIIRSVSVNTADFSLRFIAADDSTLTISLLPLFEEFRRQTTGG